MAKPSHLHPDHSVATAATMMTPIPIDTGTIELRQKASAECGECGLTGGALVRRRWSGMTIATFRT